MKTPVVKIMLERFGLRVRVSLPEKQGEIAGNLFSTYIMSVCGLNPSSDNGITSWEQFVSAIKTSRACNTWQTRRGKGMWKRSPFKPEMVVQRNDTRELESGLYNIGHANHSVMES